VWTVLVHTGLYNAAPSSPTTAHLREDIGRTSSAPVLEHDARIARRSHDAARLHLLANRRGRSLAR
jgi:hypothetical protein